MIRQSPVATVLVGVLALIGTLLPTAYADDGTAPTEPVTLLVAPPAPAYAGQPVVVRVSVLDALGQPVGAEPVLVERSDGTSWTPLPPPATGIPSTPSTPSPTGTTAPDGTLPISLSLARTAAQNRLRVSLPGRPDVAPVEVAPGLLRRASRLVLGGPRSVVDERSVTFTASWTATSGEPVAGRVLLQRRIGRGAWTQVATLTTASSGRASLTLTPREDSQWRLVAAAQEWVNGATSATHLLDNRPPGRPVVLPRSAPKPRVRMPVQPRAEGAGAHPVISTIPNRIWNRMVGRTWHSGCPVGRESLRLIEVNYWDYTGYRRRGELVVNADVADQIAAAMADLYRHRIPLRSVAREDRFGWSERVRGANDYRSMAAGNSSAFNCRDVVGRLGVRSPHAWGRSIDLNTWENPYRSAKGIVPNTWWQRHSNKRYAWRSSRHIVVRIMRRHGIRWTYGLGDTQHFDAIPTAAGGRAIADPTPEIVCGMAVCD
ncbi:M15 family metallopeptidase [Nocardioides sp.]|uniref:M15 family metallopeptidase n=1 Tax=Nocardioides sp. TaxID=35761 RepID=UPI00262C63F8|nr:M15 family metallopeptidase [Nocardioides sp.]